MISRRLTDFMSQFQRLYRDNLFITEEDETILKLVLAAAASQHLGVRTELFWLVIIGPSSGGKTTFLDPFIACESYVVSRDDCTGAAMISASDPEGLRARAAASGDDDPFDPSLVKVLDGKLFVVKDLTILLNRKDEADRFWGHMRAAYDGRLEKQSGTIGYQGAKSIRYGFLGATTDGSVEGSLVRMSKLGERAVYVRMHQTATTRKHDLDMGMRMLRERKHQHLRERRLAKGVNSILEGAISQVRKVGPSEPSQQPHSVLATIIDLASSLARLRTAPMEDTQLPHERNARTVKQFGTLCDTLSICSGRRLWTKDEIGVCRTLVRSSLPSKTRLLLDFVTTCSFFNDPARHPTAHTAARAIGVFRESQVANQLRQWVSAGIMRVDRNGRFSMMPDCLQMYADLGIALRPSFMPTPKKKRGIVLPSNNHKPRN